MTATIPSAALIPAEPVFTEPALAGFLACYSGLTREAYMLDLRQFSTWRRQHSWACPLLSAWTWLAINGS
jgi:hypothetical protein